MSDAEAHLEYAKWICETKRQFATKADASAAAERCHARDSTLKALYAYRCSACKQFHLTRNKQGKRLVVEHAAVQLEAPEPNQPKASA